jgi:hypothetical protein
MFSLPLAPPLPKKHKDGMSYTFGPHMLPTTGGYYFQGDNRVVRASTERIERFDGPVPTWLVADWMLARKRGEPLSAFAQEVLKEPQTSKALHWLNEFTRQ